MRHRVHLRALQQRQHRLGIDPGRREQLVGDRPTGSRQERVHPELHHVEDDPAHERVAVRVEPRRGEAEHDVARADPRAVHDPRALDDADGEARQVVLTGGVQVGELRGLAADEGAAREPAAGDDALHDRLDARRVKTRGADVVEEIEGLGAVDEDVVDAHGDEIDADRVVAVGEERDLELAADAVGGGDHDRLAVARGHAHEGSEAAHAREDLGTRAGAREGRDAADRVLAGVDVDAGRAVAQRLHRVAGAVRQPSKRRSWSVASGSIPTR